MVDLYNIKTLNINGSSVNDISQHYYKHMNPFFKKSSLATVSCVEEILQKQNNSEADFYVLHNSNIVRDELTCKSESPTLSYDTTYNTKITIGENYFTYPTDALDECKTEKVFLASSIQNSNNKLCYEQSQQQVESPLYYLNVHTSGDGTILDLSLEFDWSFETDTNIVYRLENFFKVDNEYITLSNEEWAYDLYFDAECTQHCGGRSILDSYYIYFKPYPEMTIRSFYLEKTEDNLKLARKKYKTTPTNENVVKIKTRQNIVVNNNKIRKITISQDISDLGLEISNSNLIVDFGNNSINRFIDKGTSNVLVVSGSYKNQNKFIINYPSGAIILPASYFDNEFLTYDTPAGTFGDFADCTCPIIVDSNLNTDISKENILDEMKRILNSSRVITN